jgi:hypothetical protein
MIEAAPVLLPCPFCGGTVAIDSVVQGWRVGSPILWSVGCDNGSCVVTANVSHSDKATAIETWNQRAP